MTTDAWPELPLAAWQDTYDTLHMWTQIVGKIRMTLDAAHQPLLERDFVRERARADYVGDPLSARDLRNRIRFYRAQTGDPDQRGRCPYAGAGAAHRGRFLSPR